MIVFQRPALLHKAASDKCAKSSLAATISIPRTTNPLPSGYRRRLQRHPAIRTRAPTHPRFIGTLTSASSVADEHHARQRHERTKEVGLRKALGARNRDIAWQFLVEALVLTFAAGALHAGLRRPRPCHSPMPLYSAMYKTANHEGDIFLKTSSSVMLTAFVILTLVELPRPMASLKRPTWSQSKPCGTSRPCGDGLARQASPEPMLGMNGRHEFTRAVKSLKCVRASAPEGSSGALNGPSAAS